MNQPAPSLVESLRLAQHHCPPLKSAENIFEYICFYQIQSQMKISLNICFSQIQSQMKISLNIIFFSPKFRVRWKYLWIFPSPKFKASKSKTTWAISQVSPTHWKALQDVSCRQLNARNNIMDKISDEYLLCGQDIRWIFALWTRYKMNICLVDNISHI